MKLMSIAKIIMINLLIVLLVVFSINMCSLIIIKVYDVYKRTFNVDKEIENELHSLPNFKNYKRQFVDELWNENQTAIQRYIYKSFIEYKALAFSGKYITVNDGGYREHKQTIEINKPAIRFFDGSTMFGVGVDDNNTIPALVDSFLNNKVSSTIIIFTLIERFLMH